jgi:negative regulator of sigma E activity
MNCDDFMLASETGGFVRRWQARRHAARCPRCAAANAAFAATKQRLATPEPLSPHVRQLWEQAACEVTVGPSRRTLWIPVAVGLGVAACVLLFVVKVAVRQELPTPHPAPQVAQAISPPDREVIVEVDPAKERSRLAAAVDRLDADMQRLRREVERLHARQQIATTLDRYGRW